MPPVLAGGEEWAVWPHQSPLAGDSGAGRLHSEILLPTDEQLQGGEDSHAVPLHRVARPRRTRVPHLAAALCEESDGSQSRELWTHNRPLQVGVYIECYRLYLLLSFCCSRLITILQCWCGKDRHIHNAVLPAVEDGEGEEFGHLWLCASHALPTQLHGADRGKTAALCNIRLLRISGNTIFCSACSPSMCSSTMLCWRQ